MKRSALSRRSPLKAKGVKLAQGSTLKASRKPIPKQSPKVKADRPRRQEVRAEVFERDGYVCQLALRLQAHPEMPAHACQGPLTVQHVKKAAQGGPYEAANLESVCWAGNVFWIEQHRREAAILGLHRDARRPRMSDKFVIIDQIEWFCPSEERWVDCPGPCPDGTPHEQRRTRQVTARFGYDRRAES